MAWSDFGTFFSEEASEVNNDGKTTRYMNEQWHVISNNVVCATTNAQTSLRIRAVWSEPLLVDWILHYS